VKITLRAATADDALRVAALLIETRSAFMPYAPSAHSDANVRSWVRSTLIPTGRVTIADFSGRVIGAMATSAEVGVSWITQMAVDPAFVGNGIGSLLLLEGLRTLTKPIRLYTFQENTGARRFYERHGFKAIQLTDGQGNDEQCPDVLYELTTNRTDA
jgi:ribosomal protein S18 acetylase RimI-like enzyme